MDKYIAFSVITMDEAIAIADIEPLYSTSDFGGNDYNVNFFLRSFFFHFFLRKWLAFRRCVFCGS